MSNSLADQLRNSGLVDKKKAQKISKEKRKQNKAKKGQKDQGPSEEQIALQNELHEKKQRDRELNLKLKEEADKKALAAQVAQLTRHYRIDRRAGDAEYNFNFAGTVKKIRVTNSMLDELARGRLCVVNLGDDNYEVVPKPIADKIRERDESAVVVYNEKEHSKEQHEEGSDDEYYAQFEIPDDLQW